jgi:hypothetical protein
MYAAPAPARIVAPADDLTAGQPGRRAFSYDPGAPEASATPAAPRVYVQPSPGAAPSTRCCPPRKSWYRWSR